ncbi:MAG TPA: ABC transporter permease, partial [Vicinamibacterales bacterium]|nr:ABC transporter permease [Vicinamibacterales bacterium]
MAFTTDLRQSARLLGRSPIFSLTSIISLALGIGAAATIFSLTDALLFEPTIGVREPSRVVDIGRANRGSGFDNMAHPTYTNLREHSQTVDVAAVGFGGGPMSLGTDGSSERVIATLVSGNYFDVLGTRAALGRFFRADEDQVPGERPVVVMSHAMWTRRFNSDPAILDKPLRLNNREFAVIGVAEEGFQGSSIIGTDLWVPMAMVQVVRGMPNASILTEPRSVWHVAIGRLKPGVGINQAQAELNALNESYKKSQPEANPVHTVALLPMGRIPGPVRTPFLAFIGFLFALTGALLAIACSNVAGMLLARAATRRREMATRLAIGAGRGRLIAQLLTETMVLFLVAAIASLPLTFWLVSMLAGSLSALPLPVSLNLDIHINIRVMLFAFGIALITGIIFGLAPARHALGGDLAPMLHGANATADRKRFRLRNGLVTVQVALSLMLVVTAFLFVRSLDRAARTDPGFKIDNIVLVNVDVALSGYREQQAVELFTRYRDRLKAIPGVESVANARMIPLQGSGFGLGSVRVPGYVSPGRDDGRFDSDWDVVSPEYFDTINMKIVEGRAFNESDRQGAPWVAIVSETFAKQAWPGQSAIGRTFFQRTSDTEERPIQIVGVSRDAKYRFISSPNAPFIYVPLAQQPTSTMEFYIRHAPGRQIAQEVRMVMAQVEPNVPIVLLQTFEQATAFGLIPQKLAALIAGVVGSIGIFLASLGLYGLMAFLVTQRTREIAIRMALGASNREMRTMVLKQAGTLGLIGGAIGLVLAGAVGTLAQSLLVGVPPIDPMSFGGTAVFFLIVLAIAAWTPATRAASTNPAMAL